MRKTEKKGVEGKREAEENGKKMKHKKEERLSRMQLWGTTEEWE